MADKKTRLVRFSAENYKKIVYANVVFDKDDNLVLITGDNGQGKTCFIEGIRAAIDGMRHSTGKPVRNGQQSAILEVDIENAPINGEIDDLHFKRVFGKGAGLTVTRSDRTKTLGNSTPLAILNSLRKQMIDPISLFEMKRDADFYNAVLPTVNLDVDLNELSIERQRIFDERTDINRNVTRLNGHLQQLKDAEVLPDDLPAKESLVSDLTTELERRREVNRNNESIRQRYQQSIATANRLSRDVTQAKEELARVTGLHKEAQEKESMDKNIAGNLQDKNAVEIQGQIETAEETNRLIRHKNNIKVASVELNTESKKSDDHSRELRKIDSEKADAVTRVTFPVEGMSFNEGVVTFNGQPVIGGTSEGEFLDICVEIACKASHELPFILVPSGSGLGSKLLKRMAKTAEKYGCTVIVEKLDETGETGIVFENGEIVKDNRE